MRTGVILRLGTGALALAALASCAASTQLSSSWTDPAATNQQFQKVAVVGVSPRSTVRRAYEDAFVAELQARGVNAVPSYSILGEGQIDKEAARAKFEELGVDGVIVTRLVDKETVSNYYPPTYSGVAAPSAYYGGWYGYYNMGYTYMSSPGYYSENKVWRLETNLYDRANEKLVWSGLTETTLAAGSAPESETKPVIHAILTDMEKHKVMPAAPKK